MDRPYTRFGLVAACAATLVVSACGSGDSSVSASPSSSATSTVPSSSLTPASTATSPGVVETPRVSLGSGTSTSGPAAPGTTTAVPDGCAPDLKAPQITDAAKRLAPDKATGAGWIATPLGGNFSPCATLSAVVVIADTGRPNAPTQALLFNKGQFLSSGVPSTYGFTDVDPRASTDDTVALVYSSAVPGSPSPLTTVVKYRFAGDHVEIVGNTPR